MLLKLWHYVCTLIPLFDNQNIEFFSSQKLTKRTRKFAYVMTDTDTDKCYQGQADTCGNVSDVCVYVQYVYYMHIDWSFAR